MVKINIPISDVTLENRLLLYLLVQHAPFIYIYWVIAAAVNIRPIGNTYFFYCPTCHMPKYLLFTHSNKGSTRPSSNLLIILSGLSYSPFILSYIYTHAYILNIPNTFHNQPHSFHRHTVAIAKNPNLLKLLIIAIQKSTPTTFNRMCLRGNRSKGHYNSFHFFCLLNFWDWIFYVLLFGNATS